MKYGVRNEISATVEEIKNGQVMCQVDLKDITVDKLGAVMTVDSAKDINLKKDDKVKVLIKAINVILVKE